MTIERTTIARPYAKAAFEYAVEKQQLSAWSALLEQAAFVSASPLVQEFISHPQSRVAQHAQLFTSVCAGGVTPAVENFLKILSEEKRLGVLPEIAQLYEELRADYEQTLNVQVDSFDELSAQQQEQLSKKLHIRLKRKVDLNVVINKDILGGLRISYGDQVIDDTVITKLKNLAIALVS